VLLSAAVTAAAYVLQLLGPLPPAPWPALLADLFSFTTLVAVFIEREKEAALACWLGACGSAAGLASGALLSAAAVSSSEAAAPFGALAAAAAAFSAAAAVYMVKLCSERPGQRGLMPEWAWQLWQQGLGVAGGGLLLCLGPLHLQGGGCPAVRLLLVGCTAVALLYRLTQRSTYLRLALVSLRAAQLPAAPSLAAVSSTRADTPFWFATLLLISQPLGALLQLLRDPAAILIMQLGAPLLPVVLAALCNALLVPRAWHNRDFMMFTGTCSCALLGGAQLLLLSLCWLLQKWDGGLQGGAVAAAIVVALGLVRLGQLRIMARRAAAADG
jgi:hypothetical protein